MPRSSIPTLPALLLGAILPGSAHGSSPQEQTLEAALWQALDGQPRSILLGSYVLEVRERVVEDPDMERFIPAIVPSPRAEAVAWLYRALNGAHVRYDEFLGAERIRFERSLAFRVGTEQLAHAEVDGIIGQVYDTDHDGRLGRRELERGNAAMERFFIARVRAAAQPGAGYTPIPALPTATAFADAWLSHQADMAAVDPHDCPDCAGVPHLDKLAALVSYLQEYAAPMEGAHAAVFAPGYNQVFLTVDAHPHPGSTLRLDGPDGRSYWDAGGLPQGGTSLDGTLDLVTAAREFPGSSYSEITRRWERDVPGAANQWMYEVLVDLAHSQLPHRLQVAAPLELEPSFEVPEWFEEELDAGVRGRGGGGSPDW